MIPYDNDVFYWINSWPDFVSPILYFFSEAYKMWAPRIVVILIGIALICFKKTRVLAFIMLGTFLVTNLITDLFKKFLPMNRPYVDLSDLILRVPGGGSFGTVSAHSANTMCIAVLLFCIFRWRASPLFAFALLSGLSRIYVGVHYPYQVLAGWILGVFMGLLGYKIYCRLSDHALRSR